MVERDWLLRRSDGLKRVRSLKLQLFWTLVGLVPSVPPSATGERRSFMDAEVWRFLMLWPRGLASLTRSLKLSFWLEERNRRRAVRRYWATGGTSRWPGRPTRQSNPPPEQISGFWQHRPGRSLARMRAKVTGRG